jgi:cell shape-determining protein MreC
MSFIGRSMSSKHLLIILTCIVLVLAFVRPGIGFKVRDAVQGNEVSLADGADAEIIMLKSQLARRELVAYQLPSPAKKTTRAEVYSRYPFGIKSEILVNVGDAEGIRVGQPARFREALVGVVTKVFSHAAVVETLFDARAKYAVRVGKKGVDALLEGGGEPHLTLIANGAEIASGVAVYAAAPSVPYGLAVGAVKEVRAGRNGLFQEATLTLPYNLSDVRVLEIMTDYSPPSL